MLITTAMLIAAGISAGAGLIASAADQAHAVAAREDEQSFNAQQAEIQRQFESGEAETARQFSAEEAQKQRDWEKMMSDTSYQRQRADLEAAGYNPASIGMTNGATTPTGATATSVAAHGQAASSPSVGAPRMSFGDYFSNLMSSAIQYGMAKDKNFTNKAIADMYATNSRQMNQMTNETRKILAKMKKITSHYNGKGDLTSQTVSKPPNLEEPAVSETV